MTQMNRTQKWIDRIPLSYTLIGMSGVGKTHLASRFKQSEHFSVDYEIAKNLQKEIHLAVPEAPVPSETDISALSLYVGKLGSSLHGGLDLSTFLGRQRLHRKAEKAAYITAAKQAKLHTLEPQKSTPIGQAITGKEAFFFNDTSGSLIEVVDPYNPQDPILTLLSEQSLLIYIEGAEEHHSLLCERQYENPKPMYYPEDFLIEHLNTYLRENNLKSVTDMHPDAFLRWVFPQLINDRLPRYRALADRWGLTLSATQVSDLTSLEDLRTLLHLKISS